MKPTYSTQDQSSIEQAALRQFDCDNLPFGHKKETKARIRKRLQVETTTRKFLDAMNSASPPKTRDEAIGSVVGVVSTLLALLVPQFAMAIKVAGWLWDYLNGDL